MLTVNLEKSLIKENKKLITPEELLIINEYEKFSPLVDDDVLSRVGLNQTLKEGLLIKNTVNEKLEETKNFNQERVFHISQIKNICLKYRLRFLPIQYYKGTLDKELPFKITNFEISYGLKCEGDKLRIIAPTESFELQEKPKDPLLFYQINNEYFYLIHKWGDDLSLSRRLTTIFESALFTWLFIPTLTTLLFFITDEHSAKVFIILTLIVSTLFQVISLLVEGEPIVFLEKIKWKSPYDD